MLARIGISEGVGGVYLALLLRDLASGLTEDQKNWYAGWKTLGIWAQDSNYGPLEQQIFEELLAMGQRKARAFLTDKGDVWDVATDALAITIGRCARVREPEFSPKIAKAVSSDRFLPAFYSLQNSYLKAVRTLAIKRRDRLLKQWSRFVKA